MNIHVNIIIMSKASYQVVHNKWNFCMGFIIGWALFGVAHNEIDSHRYRP